MARTRRQRGQIEKQPVVADKEPSPTGEGDDNVSEPCSAVNETACELNTIAESLIQPSSSDETQPKNINQSDIDTLNSWLNVIAGGKVAKEQNPRSLENNINVAIIEEDDIGEELDYWSTALICYVLGANPPFGVMNGFCNRIWGKMA